MKKFTYSTIAEKLKKSRKQFSIRQYHFKKYGISQHYISMIESSNRYPSQEMTESIYEALFAMTDGKIEELYTKENFLMNLEDQAREWLNDQFQQVDTLILNYSDCVNVLLRHELYDLAHEIHQRLFTHYTEQKNYKHSLKFYVNAIEDAIRAGKSPEKLYIEIGNLMKKRSQYENAIINYLLALDYVDIEDEYLFYQLHYKIGYLYFKMGELEKCMLYTEKLLLNCQITELIASGKLLEGLVLYKQKHYELSRDILNQIIIELGYEPYFSCVYYNIALSLHEEKKYEEALEILNKSLIYTTNETEQSAIWLFISIIYFKIQDFTNSLLYCEKSKKILTTDVEYSLIKDWYLHALELFEQLNDIQQINELFKEVSDAHHYTLLEELKLSYLKRLTLKYDDESQEFYHHVCRVLNY